MDNNISTFSLESVVDSNMDTKLSILTEDWQML